MAAPYRRFPAMAAEARRQAVAQFGELYGRRYCEAPPVVFTPIVIAPDEAKFGAQAPVPQVAAMAPLARSRDEASPPGEERKPMMKRTQVTTHEFRQRPADLIERAAIDGAIVEVYTGGGPESPRSGQGKPVAVLLPQADYERLAGFYNAVTAIVRHADEADD